MNPFTTLSMSSFSSSSVNSATIIGVIVIVIITDIVDAVSMCVKCNAMDDKKGGGSKNCRRRPPEPVPCMGSFNVRQYCMTATEYSANNTILNFVRDCTTESIDSCREESKENIALGYPVVKTCYTVCDVDGCNLASTLRGPVSLPLLFIVLPALQQVLFLIIRHLSSSAIDSGLCGRGLTVLTQV